MIALIVLGGLATAIGVLVGVSMAVIALVKVAVRTCKRGGAQHSPEMLQHLTSPQEEEEFQRIISTAWLQP